MIPRKYTKEFLEPVVARCVSVEHILRTLNLKITGGSHTNITKYIKEYGFDITHFTAGRTNSGVHHKGGAEKLTPSQLFVINRREGKEEAKKLRRGMLEIGIPYQCVGCGISDVWNTKPLSLQIDHINGNNLDNRLDNIRFLCPNCHSQTPTFGSKNKYKV